MEETTTDTLDFLPSEYTSIPLNALRVSSRKRLSLYLNLERELPISGEDGVLPDFNGLAELVGFSYLEIKNFARERNPTWVLLEEWSQRPDLNPTMGCLVRYLTQMEREDVLTDCKSRILGDIEVYQQQQKSHMKQASPIQDSTVSQSMDVTDHHVDETRVMTTDDVLTGSPTYYDAFVCYNPEKEDLTFVKLMIDKLEGKDFNLKLFVPWRNDLPGSSRYVIDAKLIQDRCRRMIIIISPQYLQSAACDFQTKYAHSLSPGSRSKRLVPVLINPCQIPQILHHVTLCDFTKNDLKEWFWDRLAKAVRAPLGQNHLNSESPVADIKLDLDLSSSSLSSSVSFSSQNSDGLSSDVSTAISSSPSLPSVPVPSLSSSDPDLTNHTVTNNNKRKKKKNAFSKFFSPKH